MLNDDNLTLLINFLQKLLREKGYDSRAINEVDNPNILITKLKNYWQNGIKMSRDGMYGNRENWSTIDKYNSYTYTIFFQGLNNRYNPVDIGEMYNTLFVLWDKL